MKEASKFEKTLSEFEFQAFPLMDMMYSTALRLTRDQLDAEDLVQNTYLKAWKYYHCFKSGTNFQAWIATILNNNFINDYRRKKRSLMVKSVDGLTDYFVGDANEGREEDLVLDHYDEIFDDSITAAIDMLPERYRLVVLMADVNELKYKEIAKILKCPIGTVMSRLSRGRQILARHLQSYAAENGYISETKGASN